MKASDAFPSKYLAASDLDDRPVLAKITHIASEAIGGKEKFILYFAGKAKGLVLNKTNWNNIAKFCGDDSDEWTGKEIVLFPTMVDFQGESVPAIRVRAPKKPQAAAPKHQPEDDDENPAPPPSKAKRRDMDDEIPF